MLTSSAFSPGAELPTRYTCDGEDVSPPLAWSEPPSGTRSFALILDDPDAPRGTFTHWLAWGLRPETRQLDEGETPAAEGQNDFGKTGYRGPCPPPGHGPHRYVFRLYALDSTLELAPGARRDDLERLIAEHRLAAAELTGTYERR